MHWTVAVLSTLGLALAAPLAGCGDDEMERGLAAPDEEAVPVAPGEEKLGEAQREQQEDDEDDAASRRAFDAQQKAAEEALDEAR